jgi:hypothetical protein
MTSQKATRVTFKIGATELDCYKLSDKCYKFNITQATKACNVYHKRYGEILERKDVKALLGEGFVAADTITKVKVETSDGMRQVSLIDMKYVSLLWLMCGTPEGMRLSQACIMESLETRAKEAHKETPNTPEQREETFTRRLAPPVTTKDRKINQKKVSAFYQKYDYYRIGWIDYQTPKMSERRDTGREATIKINIAVYGQKHFNCCRDTFMTKESQAAVFEIESFVREMCFKNPQVDIMVHVDTAIEIHKQAYGEYYFLEENKKKSSRLTRIKNR